LTRNPTGLLDHQPFLKWKGRCFKYRYASWTPKAEVWQSGNASICCKKRLKGVSVVGFLVVLFIAWPRHGEHSSKLRQGPLALISLFPCRFVSFSFYNIYSISLSTKMIVLSFVAHARIWCRISGSRSCFLIIWYVVIRTLECTNFHSYLT